MRKLAFLLLLGCAALAGGAGGVGSTAAAAGATTFLDPDEAFKVGAIATAPDRIEVIFEVAPDYWLYRSRMKFSVPEGQPVALGNPDLPKGEIKEDKYLDEGPQEVYKHDVTARLPISRGSKESFVLPVEVSWQGCTEGLCYLPTRKTFEVRLPEATAVAALASTGGSVGGGGEGFVSRQDWLASKIRNGNIMVMMGLFFLAGLALAFTPCVLPMVPIVAGLIAGGGANITRGRAFSLSLAYVLGMAATYTAAGVAVAAAGKQAQTLFQQWWIILLFSALFVAMALSMFGFFTVQMPSAIQTRLSQMSNHQRSGSYVGVVVMGALSALIVTTCVGPALVAALSVIGQSGQVARGGVALFSMAIGMGVPLLVVGASAGQLLPRAGAWMETVKQVMGALMLMVAVWMISRILPPRVAMWLWVIPLGSLVVILLRATWRTTRGRVLARAASVVVAAYAVVIGVGAARGGVDPLRPLQVPVQLPFERIKSVDDLTARISAANAEGKTVMLDFFATWCSSCKEMEHLTFPKPAVREALANTVWLQADVTRNDAIDQALLEHMGVFAPPTIAFFGLDGQERRNYRVVGYMKADEFAPQVRAALQ